MPDPFRVYNHTDREIIVQTSDNELHRLLGQSVSPGSAVPVKLWAVDLKTKVVKIDEQLAWDIAPGFDVHINETGSDTSIGAGVPVPPGAAQDIILHISGLGISPAAAKGSQDDADIADDWFYRDDEMWVTVFGAGITGLTAAHELVSRGFRVQVIERAHASPADPVDGDKGIERFKRGLTDCDVGGIARTQWATQPVAFGAAAALPLESDAADTRHTRRDARIAVGTDDGPAALRSVHGDAIWFGARTIGACESRDYRAYAIGFTDDVLTGDPSAAIASWLKALSTAKSRSVAATQLVVVVYDGPDHRALVKQAYARCETFRNWLGTAALGDTLLRLQVLPTARIDAAELDPGGNRVGLILRVHEDLGLIAGEHGFRFFPGFYRHLRDTMRRTPVFDTSTWTFTPRSALDNLQEVRWQVIADPQRPHQAAFSRKPFTTIGGLMDQYHTLRRDTGYRATDLMRFCLRILRYATSSIKRRDAYYEHMTWWDFLSKRRLDDPDDTDVMPYGTRFAEALKHSPKALVAMGAEKADARTQGNLSVQLLMDEFGLHDQSDSTLTGPTSTSWLTHWRRYLEEQGVRFFLGEVTEIKRDPDTKRATATIAFFNSPGDPPKDYLDGEDRFKVRNGRRDIAGHYFISALDVPALARVTRRERANPDSPLTELGKLVLGTNNADRDLEDITKIAQPSASDPQGIADRFQTLTGIQLYYKRHVSFANGHIYFAESPWGLSAISQVQFWGPFGSGHRGRLTGNLSIDIGAWRAGGDVARGTVTADPNTLARDAIAKSVQKQISLCMEHGKTGVQRLANYYHLDDYIAFAYTDGVERPNRNHAPFLINVVDEWSLRPKGEPWSPNDLYSRGRIPGRGHFEYGGQTWFPDPYGYPVHFENLVIAGTHVRTFTRMGTMETANESARHAVNSILDHATYRYSDRSTPPPATFTFPQHADHDVDRHTTAFGDYCDIWNPELNEFQDLELLRLIDKYLMEAGTKKLPDDRPPGVKVPLAPHVLDILRVDDLPDMLEDDRGAIGVFEMLSSMLKAFDDVRTDDLPSLLAVVERVRTQFVSSLKSAVTKP
jgi:hypothetical protein